MERNIPELNFDANSEEVFNELKDLEPRIYRRLFKNNDIKEQIFPIIFSQGTVLKMLRDYFSTKEEKAYKNITKQIDEYIKERFE